MNKPKGNFIVETDWPHKGEIRLAGVDPVNHPTHYARSRGALGVEVIDILEFFFEDRPRLWQVGKYIMRAGHKSNELEDLKKARFYLDREIGKLEDTNGETE